ncbi:MAG: hypothetical protein L7S72_07795, partial [Flavobacteriales bacterium]|nr:hypothetical protein [Flavobacteriales bacterium]
GHKWMWDFESLQIELQKLGYIDIKKHSFLKGNLGELSHIENMLSGDKIESRNLESLFVEATKPNNRENIFV